MKSIAALCSLCLLLLAVWPASAADCENWNTTEFFKTATPKAVTDSLQARADAKTRDDEYGATPLHNAAMHNQNPAFFAALLNAGADLNARNKSGRTPLHAAAAFNENPAIITALLDAGADAKAKDESGKTPFDYAREKNEKLKNTDVYWRLNDAQF